MADLRSIASTDCQKPQKMPKLVCFALVVAAILAVCAWNQFAAYRWTLC